MYFGKLLFSDLFRRQLYGKAQQLAPHLSIPRETYPEYDYYLGHLAEAAGRSNEATEYFLRYVNSSSPHESMLLVIIAYFEAIHDYSKALVATDKLLQTHPHNIQYILYGASLYSQQKEYQKSNLELKKILAIDPFHREALYHLGVNYYQLQDVANTKKVFKQLIEYYPQTAEYYNFLGYFLAEKKMDLNESKDLIEKALVFEPDNEAYLDSLAWLFYQLGCYHDAKEYIDKAITIMEQRGQEDAIIYYHARRYL